MPTEGVLATCIATSVLANAWRAHKAAKDGGGARAASRLAFEAHGDGLVAVAAELRAAASSKTSKSLASMV